MRVRPFREPVHILFHMSGGHTKVLLERTGGLGLADGGTHWDIPTEMIPLHLRGIGARFLLVGQFITPEDHDTAADVRAALRFLRVEES